MDVINLMGVLLPPAIIAICWLMHKATKEARENTKRADRLGVCRVTMCASQDGFYGTSESANVHGDAMPTEALAREEFERMMGLVGKVKWEV